MAEPATLTGSIGVLGGKGAALAACSTRSAPQPRASRSAPTPRIESPFEDFSPAAYRRFEAFLDDVYTGFKDRVAQGRHMDAAAVEAVAKGRIWSGEDAKAKGLVDALGGMATALDLAKAEAGIAPDSDVTLKLYPPAESLLRRLAARALGRGEPGEEARTLAPALALVQPALEALERLSTKPGALLMAPVELH